MDMCDVFEKLTDLDCYNLVKIIVDDMPNCKKRTKLMKTLEKGDIWHNSEAQALKSFDMLPKGLLRGLIWILGNEAGLYV